MNKHKIQLPDHIPDRCVSCPLLGVVPATVDRPKYSKEAFLCIGTAEAMTAAMTKTRVSEKTDPKHPFRRPCDGHWDMWLSNPRRILEVNRALYRDSRLPYMASWYPEIKFHKSKK